MPTIAIVGAGPGLGLPIAREFGSHGFDVALISRNPDKLAASSAPSEPTASPLRPSRPTSPTVTGSPMPSRTRPRTSAASMSSSTPPPPGTLSTSAR